MPSDASFDSSGGLEDDMYDEPVPFFWGAEEFNVQRGHGKNGPGDEADDDDDDLWNAKDDVDDDKASVTAAAPENEIILEEPPTDPAKLGTGLQVPFMAFVITLVYARAGLEMHWVYSYMLACVMGYMSESIRQGVLAGKLAEEDETIVGTVLYTVPLVVAYKAFQLATKALLPLTIGLQAYTSFSIHRAPDFIPMRRRKQTAAVLGFMSLLPLTSVVYAAALMLLMFPLTTIPMASYMLWVLFLDKSSRTGSRKPWLRKLSWGKHFCDYFPVTLTRDGPEFDPDGKYVFAYHPHGIIGLGAFGAFATDGAGFPEQFPGIDRKLLTLDSNFKVPFLREVLLDMGVCSVARSSCDAILHRGKGSAVCIVVGGAAEALETKQGTYRLVLKRKGFVRVAVENGAQLVPAIAFGETDAFETMHAERGTSLRKMQDWGQKWLGFSIPIFWGRGVFNYNFGFMPKRNPIHIFVGQPVSAEPLRAQGLEGDALIDALHLAYIQALKKLFDDYKDRNPAGIARKESLTVM